MRVALRGHAAGALTYGLVVVGCVGMHAMHIDGSARLKAVSLPKLIVGRSHCLAWGLQVLLVADF